MALELFDGPHLIYYNFVVVKARACYVDHVSQQEDVQCFDRTSLFLLR